MRPRCLPALALAALLLAPSRATAGAVRTVTLGETPRVSAPAPGVCAAPPLSLPELPALPAPSAQGSPAAIPAVAPRAAAAAAAPAASPAPALTQEPELAAALPESKKVMLIVSLRTGSESLRARLMGLFDGTIADHRRLYPERPVRVIEAKSLPQLRERMRDALGGDERLSRLVINTHGNWQRTPEGGTLTSTDLGRFGSNPAGSGRHEPFYDPGWRAMFGSLAGKALDDAEIIMHSCLVLAGPADEAVRRAAALKDYFGARSGTVYGPTMLVTDVPSPLSAASGRLFAGLAAVVAAGMGASGLIDGAPLRQIAATTGALDAFVTAAFVAVFAALSVAQSGLLVRFRDGSPVESRRVRHQRLLSGPGLWRR